MMGGLDDNPNPDRIQDPRQRLSDLIGQPLLHLETPTEHLDQTWDLAETDHSVPGQIRDVTLPEERQQMMLAQTVEINILDDDHFAVVDGEQRAVDNLIDIGTVAARQEFKRFSHTGRGSHQPFTCQILADLAQHRLDRIPNSLLVHRVAPVESGQYL